MRPDYSHALLFISIVLLGADALPNIVTRATDSIAALLASGRHQHQQPQQLPQAPGPLAHQLQPQVAQQVVAAQPQPIQPDQPRSFNGSSLELPAPVVQSESQPAIFQAQLGAFQNQAQRQLGQLTAAIGNANQLQLAYNGTTGSALGQPKYGNVLEVLSNVGKAIHQQILGSNNQIQIITSPAASGAPQQPTDLANTKKNEYQSIVVNEDQRLNLNQPQPTLPVMNINATNYKEQGEILRQEIVKRASQLQQVVASSMDVLKNNGDLIVRRLLEQMNHRLDQAKQRAEKIISEPATSEVATKALFTINQGLNNLNNIISNIVNRLDISSKEAIQQQLSGLVTAGQQQAQQHSRSGNAPGSSQILIDPNRLRQNLQQLGQQFSSAINAAQQQRHLQQNQQRVS